MKTKILVLPTLANFIIFLQKSLGETRVFLDDIWKKIRSASKYQLKNIMNMLVYIDHLLFVLKKCDDVATQINKLLIWYFWDSLRPFICFLLYKRDCD